MLIIPGVIASSYPRVSTSYESIATVTVNAGGSSSISFTSIPSTYKHLQIRWISRSSAAGADGHRISLNSDTTSGNYKTHYLRGDGSSATADVPSTTSYAYSYMFSGSGETANVFGAGVVDLLEYTNTNKYKTIRNLGGYDNNGSGNIFFNSSLWMNTNAITSITLTCQNGGNYAQYSTAALYGIKGA